MNAHAVLQWTDLLHDARLALREGNVPTRLVLDEFDVNLSPLSSRLVVVVIVVIGSSAHARTLDTARIGTVAIVGRVQAGRVGVWIGNVSHCKLRPMAKSATVICSELVAGLGQDARSDCVHRDGVLANYCSG